MAAVPDKTKGNVGKTNANMLKLGRNRAKIAAQKGGKKGG